MACGYWICSRGDMRIFGYADMRLSGHPVSGSWFYDVKSILYAIMHTETSIRHRLQGSRRSMRYRNGSRFLESSNDQDMLAYR